MKHYYRLIIIVLVFVILILKGQILLQWPSSQEFDEWSINISKELYTWLSGMLLSWPRPDTQSQRFATLSQNTKFLYGWMYDISDSQTIKRFQEQSAFYPITIILENQKYQQYGDDFAKAVKQFSGTTIEFLKDQDLGIVYTHAKTFVGDTWRVIQTANLNRTSWRDNREHFFLSQDSTIRNNLIALFHLDRQKIEHPDRNMESDYSKFIDNISPNLIVCPLKCRDKIEYILNSATQRIWISAQYIVDPRVIGILKTKKDLDIRILTNKLDTNRNLIRDLGHEHIRFDTKLYNHDKFLLVDDILVMGSMNLSANSLDNNREIGIILTDEEFITQGEEVFENR